MGQEVNYQYDAAGNLVQRLDSKNQKRGYGYDEAGRLVNTRYYNPADPVNPVKTVLFAYDDLGNLTSYDDGETSGTYVYDDVSRKILETVNYGLFTKNIAYEYYGNGTKKTFTGPDGTIYAYSYDPNNQVSSINMPGVGQITYNTYQWTRPTLITLPGGSRKELGYDALMRIKQLSSKDPGGNTVLNYQYGYDRMDNIVNKATEHGPYTYNYDSLYRLVTADGGPLTAERYSYDPVGNRLTSSNANNWIYNPNNELQSYNGVTFRYDLNGNTTQKNDNGTIENFLYNEDDRLTEVKDGNGDVVATYYYDPFGRRLWKEVGGTRTYFTYADEGLVAEFDGTGSETKSYGYAPNSTWTTNPLFMKQGTQYYFYHNDHLGTPQKMTSVTGAIAWSAKYESFGKAEIDASSTIVNNLRFPGQYYDQETGLHYNYHRYYDPRIGKYLMADPIGLVGGLNLFRYTNNPIRYTDSTGLQAEEGITRDDPVVAEVDKVMAHYLLGLKGGPFSYGPGHPWTKRMALHPHLTKVRDLIKGEMVRHCLGTGGKTKGVSDYRLNTELTKAQQWSLLIKTETSWLTAGLVGQDIAYRFGGFGLAWSAINHTCPPCPEGTGSVEVRFDLSDAASTASGSRWPGGEGTVGPNPFGRNRPFHDVDINWTWSETIIF
jgi:RHS repeat-associated protein